MTVWEYWVRLHIRAMQVVRTFERRRSILYTPAYISDVCRIEIYGRLPIEVGRYRLICHGVNDRSHRPAHHRIRPAALPWQRIDLWAVR